VSQATSREDKRAPGRARFEDSVSFSKGDEAQGRDQRECLGALSSGPSMLFDKFDSGRIEVKMFNQLDAEVMQVF
jgi:hypothetical protein